jgi:hypothetical protein
VNTAEMQYEFELSAWSPCEIKSKMKKKALLMFTNAYRIQEIDFRKRKRHSSLRRDRAAMEL